jgi:1-acyl-sn-glycerol-3-phosphate acyltransferase
MRWLYKFIYFKLMGWKLVGNTTLSKDTIKKAVIIAVPHTSWHDFFIGLFLRRIIGVNINFVGKKELFKGLVGWYLKKVGGRSIDRTSGQDKVQAIAKLFETHEEFRLSLAPEGTRKKVAEWRTGFYFIAKEARVPIIMITFDFGKKQNKISEPFYPTDDKEADFKIMYDFFKGVKGKKPDYSFN